MLFGVLNRWFGHNRVKSRDISGVVVLGGNEGIIVQNIGTAPPPEPLVVGWAEALPPQDAPGRIFNLLHWKTRLTAELIGRDSEKQDLLGWVQSGTKLSIRFLHGPGGAGKTRLAAELAESLPGWMAGFAPLEKQTRLPLSSKGLLAILDYPEDWQGRFARCCERPGVWLSRPRRSGCCCSAAVRPTSGGPTSLIVERPICERNRKSGSNRWKPAPRPRCFARPWRGWRFTMESGLLWSMKRLCGNGWSAAPICIRCRC